jgi:hypothetical protein
MSKAKLHIVHCIDTEGPLSETIEATFDRLYDSKGIRLNPSIETLQKLQNKKIDLNGLENEVADYLHKKRLAYLNSWEKVGEMIKDVTSESFRSKYQDSLGGKYTFSWLIIDIVGYKNNPRSKSIGFHSVWDKYHEFLKNNIYNDILGWHFHTVPVGGNALEYNTSWTNNDFHEQVLCRRLIERNFFPNVFRAGATIERNDISYWLEQYIPFDYSCSSTEDNAGGPGWDYDWRLAPKKWGFYNPSFTDYRKIGHMNRSIFRCLDIDTLHTAIDINEIRKAFKQVSSGETTVLAVSGHDRRDLRPEIDIFYNLIKEVEKEFPEVEWIFSNAVSAARDVVGINHTLKPNLSILRDGSNLTIKSDQKLFGSIPFIAVEEEEEVFFRANPTIEDDKTWVYKIPRLSKTKNIGIAASNVYGNVGIKVQKIK